MTANQEGEIQIQSNSIIVEIMVNANLSTIFDFSTILDFCVVQGNLLCEEGI